MKKLFNLLFLSLVILSFNLKAEDTDSEGEKTTEEVTQTKKKKSGKDKKNKSHASVNFSLFGPAPRPLYYDPYYNRDYYDSQISIGFGPFGFFASDGPRYRRHWGSPYGRFGRHCSRW